MGRGWHTRELEYPTTCSCQNSRTGRVWLRERDPQVEVGVGRERLGDKHYPPHIGLI